MRLYRQTVEDLGLYTGLELTDQQLLQLETAAGQMSAKMRAVRIVAASNVSKKDLQQRLIRKGEDAAQARQAVAWMEEMSLLDDSVTARNIADSCARKGFGLNRAKQLLYEKKIPKELWEDALADYPDQGDEIERFLRSRLTDCRDPKAVKRATDALLRRGHSYGQIKKALALLSVDTEDFLEEY